VGDLPLFIDDEPAFLDGGHVGGDLAALDGLGNLRTLACVPDSLRLNSP
jgi:hypothetical protein